MAKNEEPKNVQEAEVVEHSEPVTKKANKGVTISTTQLLLLLIAVTTIGLTAGIVYVNNKVNDLQRPQTMKFQKFDGGFGDMQKRRPMHNQLGN